MFQCFLRKAVAVEIGTFQRKIKVAFLQFAGISLNGGIGQIDTVQFIDLHAANVRKEEYWSRETVDAKKN